MGALKVHVTEENHSNVPDWLEHDKRYIAITPIARLVYGKLRKRYMTSVHTSKTSNEFIDSNGEIYCVYTVKEFMRTLGISDKTVTRAKRELIMIGLIREVRSGRNLANRYYLLEDSFYESSTEKLKPIRKPKPDKPLKTAESYIVRPNYINNLNTLNNNNIVNKNDSFQNNNIIDFQSNKKEKEYHQTLEYRLLQAANKNYTKFAIGRWTKKQWNDLIIRFVNENKNRTDINNVNGFVYGSLKKMAIHRDKKLNKRAILKELKQSPKKVDTSITLKQLEEQLNKGNIKLNKNVTPTYIWDN